MELQKYIYEHRKLTEEYESACQDLYHLMSKEIGATVIDISSGNIHIYEEDFVAAMPGARYEYRGKGSESLGYAYEVRAIVDGYTLFALMTKAKAIEKGVVADDGN